VRNEGRVGNNRALTPVLLVITALGILGAPATHVAAAAPRNPDAWVDLTTDLGANLMQATWRYRDARIVETTFPLVPGVRP